MSTGLFKVLRASAGSGKTYSLVREFLLLALRSSASWYYGQILAITFTNAAAAEMKERVILRLKEFSDLHHRSALFSDIQAALGISQEDLRARAGATFSHMLHNYGQLSILTIDSFTHRLIRSFARDLHLSYDFSIEIDADAFIEKLVDRCLESIGRDEELTRYLEMFALENLEEGSTWNIRTELISFSKLLLKEESEQAMSKLSGISLQNFRAVRKKLNDDQRSYEEALVKPALEALQLIEMKGLKRQDFFRGGSGNISVLTKISNKDFSKPGPVFYDMIKREEWSRNGVDVSVKEAIATLQPQLKAAFLYIDAQLSPQLSGRYELRRLILKNLYAMGLLSRLSEISKEMKLEENMLLISDFHKLVNDVVRESDAPFIYERIGNRYKHILFDEFQDTSTLQWANAIPLIQNALGEGYLNLLVGDAKQSIYRWRGGKVEQFVDLPGIRTALTGETSSFLSSHFNEEILEHNFRSARAVVDFNNRFYEALSPALGSYARVYQKHAQTATREDEGYVRIDSVQGGKKEERWTQTSALIIGYIRECIADGYRPCDIALLSRQGDSKGGVIASLLKQNGFNVVTHGSFRLNDSPKVRVLISFMDLIHDPAKKFAPVELVQSLAEIHEVISFNEFSVGYIRREKDKRESIIDLNGFLEEHFGSNERAFDLESIYASVIELLSYFRLELDVYLEFFLEHVREKCLSRNYSLSGFLEWWHETKKKLYISSTTDADAIRVMTIHKSKGLQFPVVIYPRFATNDMDNNIWIGLDQKEFGLTTALVKSKNSGPDPDIELPPEFEEEAMKARLDEMNVCYVATTRAEDRLYLVHEKGGGAWLSKRTGEVLDAHFNAEQKAEGWEFGTREKVQKHYTKEDVMIVAASTQKMKRPKLRVMRSAAELNAQAERGADIHACLAEIRTLDDVPNAVNKVVTAKGRAHEKEAETLRADLIKIITDKKIEKWFVAGNRLMRERDLSSSRGKILRPDRVVIFPDHVDVIDYKTGIPMITHAEQVREYMKQIAEIYNLTVNGYLLYTEKPDVINVYHEEGQVELF